MTCDPFGVWRPQQVGRAPSAPRARDLLWHVLGEAPRGVALPATELSIAAVRLLAFAVGNDYRVRSYKRKRSCRELEPPHTVVVKQGASHLAQLSDQPASALRPRDDLNSSAHRPCA
jgi:hypothetical protein